MSYFVRVFFLLVTGIVLAACGNAAPKNPIPEPVGQFDPSTEALVLFNAFIDEGDGDRSWVKVYLQKEGTTQNQYYLYSAKGDTDQPSIHRFKPGRYVFIMLSEDILTKPQEPLPVFTFDPARHIQLTPIDVKAGDVIYAGNLLIHNLRYKQVVLGRIPSDSNIRYEIVDRTDKARTLLQRAYPDQVENLETRLIDVLP